MLEVKGLDFYYGERKVLDSIGFEIPDGSVVSILGPNGVGKTTLLKCLCNLHRPRNGSITVDGQDVTALSKRELAKVISYVPQKTEISHMTVFDSILVGRKPHIEWSVTKKDKDIVNKAIDMLRLGPLSLKYTDEISGGELQKVQIARAVVQEPRILILDEPTNNLDIANQHITMHMVLDIIQNRGLTCIMTMHDINLALFFSDKLIFVKDGKILGFGGPEIVTPELVKSVYGIEADIIEYDGMPFVIAKRDQPSIPSFIQ